MRIGLRAPAVPSGLGRILIVVATVAALCMVGIGLTVAGTNSATAFDDSLLAAAGGALPQLWPPALVIDFFGEPLGVVLMASVLVAPVSS